MSKCPKCNGFGKLLAILPKCFEMGCPTCKGAGELCGYQILRFNRGQKLRERRLSFRVGLRECAERMGIQPSRLSEAEQGLAKVGEINLLKRDMTRLFSRPADGATN